MKTSLLALGLVTVLLAGCAVGPDYTAPEAPEAGTAMFAGGDQAGTFSLAVWWERLGDPLLNRLIEDALKASPTVEAATARLRSARALRQQAEAGYMPQISADGSYNWSRSWGENRSKGWNHNLSASGDASWELDLFGGIARGVEQAEAQERQQAYSLEEVRISLIAETALTYIAVREAQARLRVAEENLALQRRNADITRQRAKAGTATRYDLATARAQVARVMATLPQLRQTITEHMLTLDYLAGRAPYATREDLETLPDTLVQPGIPQRVPNDLLRRRADIRMAEEAIHAQTAAVGVATAEIYPTFSLGGTLGLSAPDLGPLSDYTRSIGFGPSIRWNIFGFGTWRKRIESQKALLEATVADYNDTVLNAYREAETAWQNCLNEVERTEALTRSEHQSSIAYDIALQIYKAGESDFSEVIVQQGNLLTAREQLTIHNYQLLTNAVAFYRALGGGWSEEPDPPTPGTASEPKTVPDAAKEEATAESKPPAPQQVAEAAPAPLLQEIAE